MELQTSQHKLISRTIKIFIHLYFHSIIIPVDLLLHHENRMTVISHVKKSIHQSSVFRYLASSTVLVIPKGLWQFMLRLITVIAYHDPTFVIPLALVTHS